MHSSIPAATKPRSRLQVLVLISAAAVLLAACGSSGGGAAASGASSAPATNPQIVAAAKAAGYDFSAVPGLSKVTVNVGQLLALTGAGAFFGQVMGTGSKLAAAQIREAGGPNIVFTALDNQTGSPDASVTGGRQLISADHVAVIQSSFGASTLALIPLIDQSKTLTFNPAGATSDQLSKSPYLWMARPTATDSFPALADYAHHAHPTAKTAAIVVGNDSSSLLSTSLIKNEWQKLGGTIATQQVVTEGATNMQAQIAAVKADHPDVIFFVLFGGDYQTALKEVRQDGMTQPVIGTDWSAQGHVATGNADNGYVFEIDAFDPTAPSPFVQMFVNGYKAAYKQEPEPYGASFYENTWQLAELIARTVQAKQDPSVSTNLLAALLKKPSMPSSLVCAPVTWNTTTHAELGKPEAISEVTSGQAHRIGLVYGPDLRLGASLPC
jgi:branched-chain amino acid transport system substrate-binding protein